MMPHQAAGSCPRSSIHVFGILVDREAVATQNLHPYLFRHHLQITASLLSLSAGVLRVPMTTPDWQPLAHGSQSGR
jgi:hypothetical protein